MTTVAILDKDARLIDLQKLDEMEEVPLDAIVVPNTCDLPIDGTYKWMNKEACFMPVGRGQDKPKQAPISTEEVLFLLATNIHDLSPEVRNWMKWYKGLSES